MFESDSFTVIFDDLVNTSRELLQHVRLSNNLEFIKCEWDVANTFWSLNRILRLILCVVQYDGH